MNKNIYHDKKYVELWLTKAEVSDNSLRESLKTLYAAYKAKKYRVVVFESGDESLLTNTKDLMRHALEVEAQREMSL